MPAVVTPRPGNRAQAWCEDCQDGVNAGPVTTRDWANTHNAAKHGNTEAAGMVTG